MTDSVPYVTVKPEFFGDAFAAIVEARRAGLATGFRPIFEHPRRRLAASLYEQLAGQMTYDAFIYRMNALAAGNVAVNGQPQAAAERSLFGPHLGMAFAHACVVADLTVFRSFYERHLAEELSGYVPTRWAVCAQPDARVPEPAVAPVPKGDYAALWVEGVEPALVALGERLLSDIRIPIRLVCAGPGAADILASAQIILSLSDDPGTAVALAAFGRPLCAATPAAAEYLADVGSFEVWNPLQAIDAILRALAGPPPTLRKDARDRLALPELPRPPVFVGTVPLVTIVMTVYDRLGHLRQNLQRLQNQTYPNIEIIVVSNDGPRADDVCAAFPNVRYIHRTHNTGVAGEPRNDGIAAARGTYVTALDDDDLFLDDHVASMVAACRGGLRAVYSNFLIQVVDPLPAGDVLLGYDIETPTAITAHELMVMNRLGYMTIFAERSVYEELGAYDNINVYGASEVELWLRMASHFPIGKVERPTTLYTIRKNWQGSLTATDHAKFAGGFEKMYARYPADDRPLTTEHRKAYLVSLRATTAPPAREPRYFVRPPSA